MKKIILLFLFISSSLSYSQQYFEIRLVNGNVGSPVTINYGYSNVSYTSNDQGLNNIFNTYGVRQYFTKSSHPYPPYQDRMASIQGIISPQLVLALQAYSSVIEHVVVSNQYSFSDALEIELMDANIGISTGTTNNIVTTNDFGLNQIFLNNNVFFYSISYPTGSGDLLKYYKVVCNCDSSQLKSQLDNYSSVVNSTYPAGTGYLSSNLFNKSTTSIAPNPFSTNFNIQTEEQISNYSLIDISGKQLINTTSKNEIDNLSSQLNSGVYFLYLQFENGQKETFKLIKK